jgi:hypothetical protein
MEDVPARISYGAVPDVVQSAVGSILINNYNCGCSLKKAIDSALAQTWRHCETVVVDDGSTDDSGKSSEAMAGRSFPYPFVTRRSKRTLAIYRIHGANNHQAARDSKESFRRKMKRCVKLN